MKLVWCPERASKAYIDTVQSVSTLKRESGVAELVSAMAAGWNAQLIVETWSQGGLIPTSIGLAIASRHTGGRHVCIVPDETSGLEYGERMSDAGVRRPETLVGEVEEVMEGLEGIDFLVVDSRRGDFARVLRLAKLSAQGAVMVRKNANASSSSSKPTFKWRGVVDEGGSRRRVVRSVFLPVGKGLDIAHVSGVGGGRGGADGKRWIKHVDRRSGDVHVIRR
ncbi:hypothetical protein HN51_062481 [Arachis hypogaea]|uniref:Uncharacterized protein n=2 Tax=Arachis hypogaea TaxID=3818 RepID=A0A445AT23_ARAHY|nr:uncharacterized protein LOC107630538 [Arachis ipaensis]XP_025628548.1 uncharacterized protein LOC112721725 [Arachis hypogaea]QHO19968.1 uncharacterized protein DS421_11g333720 [Arachis hypogaea]RYR29570.1 hypothetical protein Ahy_B01g053999 isoform A [Arachis hypogaea]